MARALRVAESIVCAVGHLSDQAAAWLAADEGAAASAERACAAARAAVEEVGTHACAHVDGGLMGMYRFCIGRVEACLPLFMHARAFRDLLAWEHLGVCVRACA